MPKISVLSAAYNHAKYIAHTVESVLAQTYSDFEYIISDDASSDETMEVLSLFRDKRIKVLKNNQNCGVSINNKRCLEQASGDYVICLPTDDVLEPHALATLSAVLNNNPNCLSVFARARFMRENGSETGEEFTDAGVGLNRFQLLKTIFEQNHVFCASAQMTRRAAVDDLNFFQKHLLQTQDMDFWAKLLFRGEVMVLPDLLAKYRQRDNNLNLSGANARADNRFSFEMSEVLKLYVDEIKTYDLLIKIFPEAVRSDWPADDQFVPFYLAQLAMNVSDFPYYRLFALRTLHNLLAQEEMVVALKEKLNFSYKDFFDLTGDTKIFFDPHLVAKKERLQNLADSQTERIKKMYEEIVALSRRKNACETRMLEQEQESLTLAQENTRLSLYSKVLEASCHQYAQSLSWKMTTPLRQLRAALGTRTK